MGDYFDWNNFGTGAQQRYTTQTPWGSGEMGNSLEQGVMQGTQLFKQQFKNLVGRDPSADELGQFQVNALASALPNGQNPGYGDLSGISQNYIQNTFPGEVTKYQQKQQNDSLDSTQTRVQDLVKNLNQQTQDYLTNPETQNQIRGQLNNGGMLDSGAYSQTLAGLMAQGATQNQANALSGVSIPALQGIQGLSGIPYQQSISQGQGALGSLNGIRDFNMQAQLAQMLGGMGQPSGFQQGLGTAFAGLQGAGNFMSGIGNYAKGKR